jgi:hypothetical protein
LAACEKFGKSVCVGLIASALVHGGEFLGHKVNETSRVIIYDTEMEDSDFKARGVVVTPIQGQLEIVKHSDLLIKIGARIDSEFAEKKVDVGRNDLQDLYDSLVMKHILSYMAAVVDAGGFDVLIIDCLYQIINEMSHQALRKFSFQTKAFCRDHKCTLLIVHHTNKANPNDVGGRITSMVSGSSFLTRATNGSTIIAYNANTFCKTPRGDVEPAFVMNISGRVGRRVPDKVIYLNYPNFIKDQELTEKHLALPETKTEKDRQEQEIRIRFFNSLPEHPIDAIARGLFVEQAKLRLKMSQSLIDKSISLWREADRIRVFQMGKSKYICSGSSHSMLKKEEFEVELQSLREAGQCPDYAKFLTRSPNT